MKEDKKSSASVDKSEHAGVEKLRSTKHKYEEELRSSGTKAGSRFAEWNPDYAQLRRLQRWSEKYAEVNLPPLEGFADLAEILSGGDGSEEDISQSMRDAHGDDIDEDVWLDAFVKAALQKFDELSANL